MPGGAGVRRSLDDGFLALREHVRALAERRVRPAAVVFVYAAEQEAAALARFPRFAKECAAEGRPIELVDAGQGFCRELELQSEMLKRLEQLEQTAAERVVSDLATLAQQFVQDELTRWPEPPALCRLLVNSGALGTLVSYSALTNGLPEDAQAPVVIAFPGEDDQRSLNLLGLRGDMNYRIPRV
jgi:hypothetical protein